MKKLFLLLLFLPMFAFGEHHRGHAQTHIAEALDKFHAVNRSIEKFLDACSTEGWTQKNLDSISVIENYAQLAFNNATTASEMLDDPNIDLDEVRKMLNAPNNGPNDFDDGARRLSVADRIVTVIVMAKGLDNRLKAESYECERSIDFTIHGSKGWQAIDNAIWHVQDAIREEVYFDPEFICSGPNNHCE